MAIYLHDELDDLVQAVQVRHPQPPKKNVTKIHYMLGEMEHTGT
jgi:hypothetical protein